VLVVDNDASIRAVVRQTLEEEGHRVAEAADGAAALMAVERGRRFDLILLDLAMPVMDGWQFAEKYWKLPTATAKVTSPAVAGTGRAPLLVFTAEPGMAAARHAEQLKAAGFLTKPFDLGDLVAAVERCAARAGTEESRETEGTGEAGEAGRAVLQPQWLRAPKPAQEDIRHQQRVTRLRTHLDRLQREMGEVRQGVAQVAEIEAGRHLTRDEARWAARLRLESERLRLELQELRHEFYRLKDERA
jgi:CheY-like chemotaxis protein